MSKQEAEKQLADHELLSQQVYGKPTDWRMEKHGKDWVLVATLKGWGDK